MAADKPKVDVGLLFGPPGGGGSMGGPDADFKDLAHAVLDDKAPMAARVDALHELIHSCISQAKSSDSGGDAGSSDEAADSGGY